MCNGTKITDQWEEMHFSKMALAHGLSKWDKWNQMSKTSIPDQLGFFFQRKKEINIEEYTEGYLYKFWDKRISLNKTPKPWPQRKKMIQLAMF